MKGSHDIGPRIQGLTLAFAGMPIDQIVAIVGLSCSQIRRLKKQAIKRGYDPSVSTRLLAKYVEDAPRSGRPRKHAKPHGQKDINTGSKDGAGREELNNSGAMESAMSATSEYGRCDNGDAPGPFDSDRSIFAAE